MNRLVVGGGRWTRRWACGAGSWVRRKTGAAEDLIGDHGSRRTSIPDYRARQKTGLWVTSNRVERFNDWAVSDRRQGHGMRWVPPGVISLAALEAARQNWRRCVRTGTGPGGGRIGAPGVEVPRTTQESRIEPRLAYQFRNGREFPKVHKNFTMS